MARAGGEENEREKEPSYVYNAPPPPRRRFVPRGVRILLIFSAGAGNFGTTCIPTGEHATIGEGERLESGAEGRGGEGKGGGSEPELVKAFCVDR